MALGVGHCGHKGRPQERCGWVVALAEAEATEMLGPHCSLLPREGDHVPNTWALFPLSSLSLPYILQLLGVCQITGED